MTAARRLLDLSQDEQRVVVDALCNPLMPEVAVALCTTCHSLGSLMSQPLAELRQQHDEVLVLCAKLRQSRAAVHASVRLNWKFKGLDATDAVSVGMLFRTRAMPTLREVHLDGNPLGDDGLHAMAAGIVPGALRCLITLVCMDTQLGLRAVEALAAAVDRRGLPSLSTLNLSRNQIGDEGVRVLVGGLDAAPIDTLFLDANHIGDAGMRALTAAARGGGALCELKHLSLSSNEVGDAGLDALATLDPRALPALELLWLDDNRVGDGGLARLTSALAENEPAAQLLPSLVGVYVEGNPVGEAAQEALRGVLAGEESE